MVSCPTQTKNLERTLLQGYSWSKVNAAGQERALRIREKKKRYLPKDRSNKEMKKDTIFCFPTKNCVHVITDNYEKTFLGPPFHSVKNYETIKKYSLHVICQILNFKCQIEFEKYSKKSDEIFLCTYLLIK